MFFGCDGVRKWHAMGELQPTSRWGCAKKSEVLHFVSGEILVDFCLETSLVMTLVPPLAKFHRHFFLDFIFL